ncbi:MAG TPA: acyltransferase [Gemmatimonadales bacterium]|nr:acyltransferase [Gemmatimonadales bacterium]
MKDSTGGTFFDLRDTAALKALGILAIVLHNLYHQLPSAVNENEFSFDPRRFEQFLATVVEPRQTVQATFSFLGHFGVQLFIFLSAYGLALKHWTTSSWSAFVWGRVKKIYPTFLLSLATLLLLQTIQDGPARVWAYLLRQGDELLLTTLAVQNLIPGMGLPPVGPWWFLPFIIQFYCLWPALAALSRRFAGPGLAAIAVAGLALSLAFQWSLGRTLGINLLTTPLGHLPELCLGVACARYGFQVNLGTAIVAAVFFILGNMYASLWLLTFISALVLLLYGYQLTAGALRERRLLEFLARISMPLFFVNGFMRGPFLIAAQSGLWYVELAVGLSFAVTCAGVAYILTLTERSLVTAVQKRNRTREPASSRFI